jgi:hypothetical protein
MRCDGFTPGTSPSVSSIGRSLIRTVASSGLNWLMGRVASFSAAVVAGGSIAPLYVPEYVTVWGVRGA